MKKIQTIKRLKDILRLVLVLYFENKGTPQAVMIEEIFDELVELIEDVEGDNLASIKEKVKSLGSKIEDTIEMIIVRESVEELLDAIGGILEKFI